MLRKRYLLVLCLGSLTALPVLSHAQQQKSREEVNALYADRYNKLEEEHVAALSKVAATEEGEAANATYRLLFSLAIARNAYSAAEPAAEAVIKKDSYASDVEMLAHFINVIAEADQGKFAESLDDLKAYVQTHKDARKEVDPDTILAIGEAYFQRLIGAGKHDVAKQLCEFAATSPHEAVKAHFAKRASRLGLVGKPAPAVSGNNVDGKPLSLADFKGKVVLVDFWATWCPPCSMQMIRLNTLHEKYKDAGLEIVGVNVDGLRENADPKETKSLVRRYVIDHQARFPSILLEADDSTIPKAFGVEEIPANFLIDRKGNIIQFELNEGGLIKAIEDALKS